MARGGVGITLFGWAAPILRREHLHPYVPDAFDQLTVHLPHGPLGLTRVRESDGGPGLRGTVLGVHHRLSYRADPAEHLLHLPRVNCLGQPPDLNPPNIVPGPTQPLSSSRLPPPNNLALLLTPVPLVLLTPALALV